MSRAGTGPEEVAGEGEAGKYREGGSGVGFFNTTLLPLNQLPPSQPLPPLLLPWLFPVETETEGSGKHGDGGSTGVR